MCVNFSSKQYIRLLEKEKNFYTTKKNNLSFYDKNPEEYKRLSFYETLLRDQIRYNNKEKYN